MRQEDFERLPPASLSSPSRLPPPSTACPPASCPDCRGRLSIAYQITDEQLQGAVEVAFRTATVQVLTTLGWAGRIDDFSCRLLTDALRTAAHPDNPDRLRVFAAVARDLFRHTSKTLAPRPRGGARRQPTGYPARHGLSDPFNVDALPGDLLAAIDDLRNDTRLRPRTTVTDRAKADRCVRAALSALQELYASFGSYLEQALQPLEPHVSREAVRAFVLETRRELDELAACHTVGDVYVESLTITEPGDKSLRLEVAGHLGAVRL